MLACHVIENHGHHHHSSALVDSISGSEHRLRFADRRARLFLRDARVVDRLFTLGATHDIEVDRLGEVIAPESTRGRLVTSAFCPIVMSFAIDGRLWCSTHQ
jgi:hypothetical protein